MKKRGKKAKKEKAENEAENGRKGKNVRYTPSGVLRRVILIFAALYLAGMGISTALVQQKFRQDHQRYLGDIADLVKLSMSEEIRDATAQGKEITSEWFADRLEFFLALCSSDPHVNWNAAVWDSEGDKIAERGAIASAPLDGDSTARVIWHLKDYLTEEELDQLAEYAAQETASEKRQWTEYEENVSSTPEGELASISIQKEKWKKVDSLEAENLEEAAGWADIRRRTEVQKKSISSVLLQKKRGDGRIRIQSRRMPRSSLVLFCASPGAKPGRTDGRNGERMNIFRAFRNISGADTGRTAPDIWNIRMTMRRRI